MSEAPVLPRARRPLEFWIALCALLVLCGSVLWRVPAYLSGPEPVGEDSSSHILASARVAEYLRTGSDGWWMSDLNLGFPLAHFYHPLPHVATGALALVLGGPEESALAYKLLVVLLLIAVPFTATLGFSRLGLGRVGALCAAVALATISAPKAFYGLTPRHYLLSGLYTMLWGAVFVPLALAEGVRFLQGRGRLSLATGAFALLFLSHALLALGLVPVFVFVACLAPEGATPLRARLTRLVLFGAATGGVIAFWLLPQLLCSDYFGGWPISRDERANGFGLGPLLRDWALGRFTDLRRVPIFALASFLGCVAAAVRLRRAQNRIVLFGVLLFVVFCAGRETFGPLVDWVFPPNRRIEGMMRWIALLHLFLAIAIGVGVDALLELVERLRSRLRSIVAGGATALLLALVVPGYVGDIQWGLDTFHASEDHGAYLGIAKRLKEAPEPGRVYTAEPVGHATHWVMAYLALLTGKPMTLSYGVGVQDSLNFYYLWSFGGDRPAPLVRDKQRAALAAELFNVRYLVVRPGFDAAYLHATTIAHLGPYQVLRLPGRYGYFDVIDPPDVLAPALPVHLRTRLERWMREEYPRGARFLRLPEPVHQNFPGLPSATLGYREEQMDAGSASVTPRTPTPPGEVLEEEAGTNRYRARVRVGAGEAWALLKATPHPWWRAEVDGKEQPVYYLSPAFQGVPLGPGEHEVVFVFQNPGWQKALLVLSPLLLGALVALERARRRVPGR